LPAELLLTVHDRSGRVRRKGLFRSPPIHSPDGLVDSFRVRFFREAFEAQALNVLLQPLPQHHVADHLEHNAADLGAK
jgi:hypothetical protein